MKAQSNVVVWLPWVLLGTIGVVLGYKPLTDPDLGWHLAGGLWMYESKGVPFWDFLGAEGSKWHAYSWLPELAFAGVFKIAGFFGLQIFQVLLIVAFVFVLYLVVRECALQTSASFEQRQIVSLFATLVMFLLSAPVWQLRPQLISLICFSILIFLLETKRLSYLNLLLLMLVWANSHVYWIFSPFVVFLYQIVFYRGDVKKKSIFSRVNLLLISLTAPLLNPYGVQIYETVVRYMFSHKVAESLISEFQPLSMKLGYVLPVFVIMLIFFFISFGRWRRALHPALIVLIVLFSILSVMRIKFLPLFAVLFAVAGAVTITQMVSLSDLKKEKKGGKKIAAALSSFVLVSLFSLQIEPPLPKKYGEMLQIATSLQNDLIFQRHKPLYVLNTLEDGGWLGLFFFLTKMSSETESRFKTTIDGRTLVMGEKRLQESSILLGGGQSWEEILENWAVEIAFLPREHRLSRMLLESGKWKVYHQSREWIVFVGHREDTVER